ncbi:MAG: cytochrome c biogenesis protein CcsA [Phycisphaerales bacterium]
MRWPLSKRQYWLGVYTSVAIGVALAIRVGASDPALGSSAAIVYLHVPAAMMMYVACAAVFAASAGYLWQRSERWDDVNGAAAEVGALLASISLSTGMVWARDAWGQWWVWSPRLSFTLALWALLVGLVVIRRSMRCTPRRATVSAVVGMVAFLDVPLVYLSVKLIPDVHPVMPSLTPDMRAVLLYWLLPTGLVCGGLAHEALGVARGERTSQGARAAQEAMPAGEGQRTPTCR